jgi:hypothetical protein
MTEKYSNWKTVRIFFVQCCHYSMDGGTALHYRHGLYSPYCCVWEICTREQELCITHSLLPLELLYVISQQNHDPQIIRSSCCIPATRNLYKFRFVTLFQTTRRVCSCVIGSVSKRTTFLKRYTLFYTSLNYLFQYTSRIYRSY